MKKLLVGAVALGLVLPTATANANTQVASNANTNTPASIAGLSVNTPAAQPAGNLTNTLKANPGTAVTPTQNFVSGQDTNVQGTLDGLLAAQKAQEAAQKAAQEAAQKSKFQSGLGSNGQLDNTKVTLSSKDGDAKFSDFAAEFDKTTTSVAASTTAKGNTPGTGNKGPVVKPTTKPAVKSAVAKAKASAKTGAKKLPKTSAVK